MIEKELRHDTKVSKELSIKISGCPNSCSHHQIGMIGLFGNAAKVQGGTVPMYRLLIGGETEVTKATFGSLVVKLPAKQAHRAVVDLIKWFKGEMQKGETIKDVLGRTSKDKIQKLLEPYRRIPTKEENPDLYQDWEDQEPFQPKVGHGECGV